MFKEAGWEKNFEYPWEEVFNTIKYMPISEKYSTEQGKIEKEKIIKLLVEEHDFSQERVEGALDKLMKSREKKQQKGLAEWI